LDYVFVYHVFVTIATDDANMTASAGIQGHVMYIDENGDAEANYTVVALITVSEDSEDQDDYSDDGSYLSRKLQSVGHFVKDGDDIPVSGSEDKWRLDRNVMDKLAPVWGFFSVTVCHLSLA
jgi:hypothetical protein